MSMLHPLSDSDRFASMAGMRAAAALLPDLLAAGHDLTPLVWTVNAEREYCKDGTSRIVGVVHATVYYVEFGDSAAAIQVWQAWRVRLNLQQLRDLECWWFASQDMAGVKVELIMAVPTSIEPRPEIPTFPELPGRADPFVRRTPAPVQADGPVSA